MKNIIFILVIGLLILSSRSCDEVDGSYGNQIEIEDPTELTRKAVIFEFTGIHCTNCPGGHEAIEQIDSIYHGHVIPISVHAGYFSEPYPGEPDFRTSFGNQLFENLGEPFTPSVIFASMHPDSAIIGGPATWQGEVGYIVPQYTKYIIEPIITVTNNTINATYNITERDDVSTNLRFYAFIIEDHIEGPQTGTDIDPYDHRHVLRKCFSNFNGNTVSFNNQTSSISLNTAIDETWDVNNLYVVGIIVDEDTKEIYTGEQRKLIDYMNLTQI